MGAPGTGHSPSRPGRLGCTTPSAPATGCASQFRGLAPALAPRTIPDGHHLLEAHACFSLSLGLPCNAPQHSCPIPEISLGATGGLRRPVMKEGFWLTPPGLTPRIPVLCLPRPALGLPAGGLCCLPWSPLNRKCALQAPDAPRQPQGVSWGRCLFMLLSLPEAPCCACCLAMCQSPSPSKRLPWTLAEVTPCPVPSWCNASSPRTRPLLAAPGSGVWVGLGEQDPPGPSLLVRPARLDPGEPWGCCPEAY